MAEQIRAAARSDRRADHFVRPDLRGERRGLIAEVFPRFGAALEDAVAGGHGSVARQRCNDAAERTETALTRFRFRTALVGVLRRLLAVLLEPLVKRCP